VAGCSMALQAEAFALGAQQDLHARPVFVGPHEEPPPCSEDLLAIEKYASAARNSAVNHLQAHLALRLWITFNVAHTQSPSVLQFRGPHSPTDANAAVAFD